MEITQVRLHPLFTQRILERVRAFGGIVEIASAHHERLDGKGYHRRLPGSELCPLTRALAVADVCEALTADRPYRAGLPWEQVLGILRKEAGAGPLRRERGSARVDPGGLRLETRRQLGCDRVQRRPHRVPFPVPAARCRRRVPRGARAPP